MFFKPNFLKSSPIHLHLLFGEKRFSDTEKDLALNQENIGLKYGQSNILLRQE